SSSKGTVTGFAAGSSARAARARRNRPRAARMVWRFMSEALPDLDGDFLVLAVAFDEDGGAVAGFQLPQVAAHVVQLADGAPLEFADVVAGLDARPVGGPLREHALDRHALVALDGVEAEEAARHRLDVGLGAQEGADHFHEHADELQAAGASAAGADALRQG